MRKQCVVEVSRFAEKQLKRVPAHIRAAIREWALSVEGAGIWDVRTLPGYHDEPLRGAREGQRSVRMSRAYRVIYTESETGKVVVISVQEVSKHDY